MEIKTEITVLHHTGGTKFYEVSKFYNHAGKRYVVVYRWGKNSEIRGGGQTKVENFAGEVNANEAARKRMSEKIKRGYEIGAWPDRMPSSFDADITRLKLGEHFNDSDTVELVMSGLALSDVLTASQSDINHLFGRDDIVVEEPEPEIERGEEWASW